LSHSLLWEAVTRARDEARPRVEWRDRRGLGDNLEVYGADKLWTQLNREGIRETRGTVERLRVSWASLEPAGPALQGDDMR
jgi:hypothetical protein